MSGLNPNYPASDRAPKQRNAHKHNQVLKQLAEKHAKAYKLFQELTVALKEKHKILNNNGSEHKEEVILSLRVFFKDKDHCPMFDLLSKLKNRSILSDHFGVSLTALKVEDGRVAFLCSHDRYGDCLIIFKQSRKPRIVRIQFPHSC